MTERREYGLIERVIENWLTNTNEKGYQIPFCQYLISEKDTIIYISPHGPMEQGKDIISIDKNGIVYAYQLKGGDINLTEWRNIQGEIDDLITIPIKHPSIDASTSYIPFLVTNGEISDPVRVNIVDKNLNYKRLGFPELRTITGPELLQKFITVHGSFLPLELSDFKVFLELLLSQGDGFLNKELYVNFIESILFAKNKNKPDIIRKISSSILMTQYILQPYEKKENHIAIIEGWIILCSYIFNLVEKFSLKEKDWIQSNEIIINKINDQLEKLKEEFASKDNYLEGTPLGDGGKIYKARVTVVLGWLSAYELFRKKSEDNYDTDINIHEYVKKLYPEKMWYWGESSTPFFVMMSLLAFENNDLRLSNKIITDMILEIIFENDYEGKGVPNPYITSDEIIASSYGVSEFEHNPEEFKGSSYHLETLVDILVRKERRDLLEILWRKITFICKETIVPNLKSDLFLWRCKEGTQVNAFYENPQSWKQLTLEANEPILLIPKIIDYKLKFMYYFLLCYPHRLNRDTIKCIDPTFYP